MEAEAAALSQLQLQLLALVSELRLTRERERAAREELHASSEVCGPQIRSVLDLLGLSGCSGRDVFLTRFWVGTGWIVQRWKAAEEERRREARELRAELAARDEALQRLESRVKCLENENELLERNEKDLKENIERLLQSREAFMRQQDSACSLQWTIQMRDKQITVISEKLNSHLALFNSVGKEVAAVKQVLGDVECLVGEKENVVSDLKCKVQRISVLEKDFVGMVASCNMASLVSDYYLTEMLVELHNMETALQKFQDIFSRLGHEEMKSSLPVSESQDCKVDSIPGSQVDLPNEDRMIPIIDETANANVECKSEIDTGSNQVQSPPSLKHYALPCSEPVTANVEKSECPPESEDIEMGNSSPEQQTHSANPDPEVENQS
ncbi:hypothetical protein TRIUR3_11650 [Triticum urartu]|uniref:Uncharacterized protein n=2 Tax=Triticum TaxID=4564 RepID=A0A9R0Z8Y9_TRITD|nr:hypothetical protein TRIUR3_11650 [Triticum urartu]VAI73494.1 unnamed protein product [Triticum turgidum subsp. durum]